LIYKVSRCVISFINKLLFYTKNIVKYAHDFIPATVAIPLNLISNGYGNRTSNTLFFEECGINQLLEKCGVMMVDRRFKCIQTILNKKQCVLIIFPAKKNRQKKLY